MRKHRWMACVAIAAGLCAGATVQAETREREALNRVEADLGRVERELMALRVRHTAAGSDDKPVLAAEIERRRIERQELLPRFYEAMLQAYQAEETPDEKINQMMIQTLRKHMGEDRWEEAADFAQAMADKGHPEKGLVELAGIAAFNANRFEQAREHLKAARKAGQLGRDGERFASMADQYVEYWNQEQRLRQAEAKADDLPRVRIETTAGVVEIELFENQAPNTVANFVHLVESGFYNGTVFHRVLPNFMAQGGDPTGRGSGGPGWAIRCECGRDDFRRHFRGTLSMAHAGPDTGGSQFFLTFVPTPHLDRRHTAFGRVIDGWATLANITRRDPGSHIEPTKIVRATVSRKRDVKYVPEKIPSRR